MAFKMLAFVGGAFFGGGGVATGMIFGAILCDTRDAARARSSAGGSGSLFNNWWLTGK